MLYVHFKAGERRALEDAFSARIINSPEGDILECLDASGQVVARFMAVDVLFYSRLPHEDLAPGRSRKQRRSRSD